MSQNFLLNSLPGNVFEQIRPHLRTAELQVGDSIAELGETINLVYFPHSGMISFIVELLNGAKIETAMVGREGIANAGCAINGGLSLTMATVQVAGVASVIEAKQFAQLVHELPPLLSLVGLHEQIFIAQTQQSSACHAAHTAEARLSRWFLQLRNIIGSDRLHLTQEFVAQMLGVQRASVSSVAVSLREKGLIQYSRGTIDLLDIDGLHRNSCECYDAVRSHYKHLPGFSNL
jgi:CRP-like cAMP-binding protein